MHITIARNRPPEKIAAEIERRFLPWYLAAYAEQLKRAEQHNASRNRQQEVTVELAALLGPEASRRMQSNPNQIYAPGLTVDVHGNGESVSIQLRYKSVKVAKAVLKALGESRRFVRMRDARYFAHTCRLRTNRSSNRENAATA